MRGEVNQIEWAANIQEAVFQGSTVCIWNAKSKLIKVLTGAHRDDFGLQGLNIRSGDFTRKQCGRLPMGAGEDQSLLLIERLPGVVLGLQVGIPFRLAVDMSWGGVLAGGRRT